MADRHFTDFSNLSVEHQEVVRKFLMEADQQGSSSNFEGTCQQLNHVLPFLRTLCPSIRPSSIGVRPGDMVQTILVTYSHGDLVIPDFILDPDTRHNADEDDVSEYPDYKNCTHDFPFMNLTKEESARKSDVFNFGCYRPLGAFAIMCNACHKRYADMQHETI
jgi:hypothetical protein